MPRIETQAFDRAAAARIERADEKALRGLVLSSQSRLLLPGARSRIKRKDGKGTHSGFRGASPVEGSSNAMEGTVMTNDDSRPFSSEMNDFELLDARMTSR